MVSSNQTRSFFGFLRGAATCAALCWNSRELEEYCSKPRRFAEVTLRCSAQQPEPYRDREQIEKIRQLDSLEFLRAVGAAGAHTICARRRCQQTRRPAHFFLST